MASQLLYNASCYERMATSNANADLKQPLVVVQDLESSQSSSSSQEEQDTDISKRRVSILIIVKSFCFGAYAGLLLHTVVVSAVCVMFKQWGNNAQPDESAPFSYWTLYFLILVDTVFYTLVMLGIIVTMTRKGSMHMRKKFDNDAHAPNSESVWTPRFLFVNGIGFHIGAISGSYGSLAIIDSIVSGMPIPLVPLLCSVLVDVGLCCLMFKCFDSAHEPFSADDELEEDSFFI